MDFIEALAFFLQPSSLRSVTDLINTVEQKKAGVPLFISAGAAPLFPKDVKSLERDFVVTYRRPLVCKPPIIRQFLALYVHVDPRVSVPTR